MTETQKRIEAYQKLLPDIKEKVVAVAMLLALSVVMLTSASFAWLTISRAPEVTAVSTNVAANGNLEIALATGDGTTPPEESKVGDSSARQGQSVTAANITWGNLVNLNDPSYGLDNLVLRPAKLNTSDLLKKPLFGARYGEDGRIVGSTSAYTYTSWISPKGNIAGYFGEANEVGVRAVSSIKKVLHDFENNIFVLSDTAVAQNGAAADIFSGIVENEDWMAALAKLLGKHMTASLNSEPEFKNAEVSRSDVKTLRDMYAELVKAHEAEAEAIATLINLQYYLIYGGNEGAYTPVTADYVLGIPEDSNKFDVGGNYIDAVPVGTGSSKNIVIKNLKAFLVDYNKLSVDLIALNEKLGLNEDGTENPEAVKKDSFLWNGDGLAAIVERLMIVDQCELRKKGDKDYQSVKYFTDNITNILLKDWLLAWDLLNGNPVDYDICITNGVLKNFEQRVGTNIGVTMQVEARMKVSQLSEDPFVAIINASVETSAASPYYFSDDLDYAESLKTGADDSAGEITAEDTYAMVIDLWVRTNSDNSVLVLEGGAIIESEERIATGKDMNGNTVELYTMKRTFTVQNEDGTTETKEDEAIVYYVGDDFEDENGSRTWYNEAAHIAYKPEEIPEGTTFTKKMETVYNVEGYEGENRVWDSTNGSVQAAISTDSATQGSGSCYVFYADTPEDQARSLELLKSLEVAFVDREGEGSLLATAKMDTEHFFAENGRVIVPLYIAEGGVAISGDDGEEGTKEDTEEGTEEGAEEENIKGITELIKNEARKITAIIYLDGDEISNKEVLSAANIQGQLNIQLGTDAELDPANNKELEQKIRRVSASVNKSEFSFDESDDLTVNVTVDVEGDQPENVRAFFLRRINDTQGSREGEMIFTHNADGKWVSQYTFTAPGEYVLRTVELDGQEYVLDIVPEVKIDGFTIREVSCSDLSAGERNFNVLTGDSYHDTTLTVRFASGDEEKMPGKVQGRFIGPDNNIVDVAFNYDATTTSWKGKARFVVSGEYTLQYLILDGAHEELDSGMWINANVKLGVKVKVETTMEDTSFLFDDDKPETLDIRVKIFDNANNEMQGLNNVDICYKVEKGNDTLEALNLTWNGTYYVGNFETDDGHPGNWIFDYVAINIKSHITNVISSPTFTMISPNPPSLADDPVDPIGYIYAPDGDAKMTVKIKDSETATVAAVIGTVEVQGKLGSTNEGISTWNFTIPENNGTQDGYWTMNEIRIWNYYDPDIGFVEAELDGEENLVPDGERDEPLTFDISGYTEKVVETVKIALIGDYKTEFGVDENGNVVDEFMKDQTISGLSVEIKDFEDKPLSGIGNIKLNLTYGKDSEIYGGYTIKDLVNQNEHFVSFSSRPNEDTAIYSQLEDEKIQYAGTYTTSISFTVGTESTVYNGKELPTFEVWSKTPTVKIANVAFKINDEGETLKPNGVDNVWTDTYATVHFGYWQWNSCGISGEDYPHSKVTIALLNGGNAQKAELFFETSNEDKQVLMYSEDLYDNSKDRNDYITASFEWSEDQVDCDRWIGELINSTGAGNDTKNTAGTLTANRLVLTYNGTEFEVLVYRMYPGTEEITIYNPS